MKNPIYQHHCPECGRFANCTSVVIARDGHPELHFVRCHVDGLQIAKEAK